VRRELVVIDVFRREDVILRVSRGTSPAVKRRHTSMKSIKVTRRVLPRLEKRGSIWG
jgi:ribose 1,5-bisphosphokinase PhnN